MNKSDVHKVLNWCEEARNILILGHKSPDGDAIGSTLGLSHYLKKKGISSTVMVPDVFPEFLKWLPGSDEVKVYDKDVSLGKEIIENADLIFTLDFNHLKRVGAMTESLEASNAKFVMIDHHQEPSDYSSITLSDTSSCSTAQMVYEFIEAAEDLNLLDETIGENLYCGIMTDTGSFRFSSVTPKTHEIAAMLMRSGTDHAKVHRAVYDTNHIDRLKLVGYALSNKLEILPGDRVALIWLSQKELEQFNYRKGDTEGLVNQALSIQGINCAAFIREGNNQVKMSFRSKGPFDVNKLARTHFNGGGHMNAAGGMITDKSIEEVVAYFKTNVASYDKELEYAS